MDLEELSRMLRERRESLGLQVDDVAGRIGASPAHVEEVERASTRPRQEELERWTEALAWDQPHLKELLLLAGEVEGS
ncbi:MAG: helix-turn-helix transcriptional regulator [Chloroflexi bacterium]|nr:helix-turn-helix transcriptional regulator [Chloroflexota bacterium]